MGATIRDIAGECNVSVSTVSRALNGTSGVSAATTRRVEEAAKRLGYSPNLAARSLRATGTDLIGIFLKGPMNLFFQELLELFEPCLRDAGYTVSIVRIWHHEDEVAITRQALASNRFAGAIFLGGWFNAGAEGVSQVNVPAVWCTTSSISGASRDSYSTVVMDDCQAMTDLVQYLRGLGHSRIAYMGRDEGDVSVGSMRWDAFVSALEDSGAVLSPDLLVGQSFGDDQYSYSYGYRFAQRLAVLDPPVTAVVAVSDAVALGAVRGFMDAGLRVPEDISVAGVDGISLTDFMVPRLSTVVQPASELVSQTWQQLLTLMSGGKHQHLTVPGVLVTRESTGRLA